MKLSSVILLGISGRLTHDSDGVTIDSLGVSKRAIMSRLGSTVLIPVTIVSVTAGSFGIINLAAMHQGEQFNLRVSGRSGNRHTVRCLVIGCTKTASKRFRIDAEMLHSMEDNEHALP
jgi:hypothetical protein